MGGVSLLSLKDFVLRWASQEVSVAQNRIRARCFVSRYLVCKTDIVLPYPQEVKEIQNQLMLVRYSPTAVVTNRQAIKSSACDLATFCYYNVDNLISKSSWWTNTYRLLSFTLQIPPLSIIFFSPWCRSLHWHHGQLHGAALQTCCKLSETPPAKIHLEAKPVGHRVQGPFGGAEALENLNFRRSIAIL